MRRLFPLCLISLIACGPFFYQAPPSIGSYPERIATKRWTDFLQEAAPLDPAAPPASELDEQCNTLYERLRAMATADRLAEIDRLLQLNRSGPVYSSARANLLHEFREIAADPALFDRADSYFSWRLSPPAGPVPAYRRWDMPEEEFKLLNGEYQKAITTYAVEMERNAASSDGALKPYWNVQIAAHYFRHQHYDEAMKAFGEVARDFPDHPRAEVARLMMARCDLSRFQSLVPGTDGQLPPGSFELLGSAETKFNEFIARYPTGRFTPDAHGWLGAVDLYRRKYTSAIGHQLDRLNLQPTREITRTVLRECDAIFTLMLGDDGVLNDPYFADRFVDPSVIARNPLVVRLFLQHALDPSSSIDLGTANYDSYAKDSRTIDLLNRRIFRPQKLVKNTLIGIGAELLKPNAARLDQTALTLLAWSASEADENEQALALIQQVTESQPRDEVLHAKAIILQRLGRHAEAVAAFDALAAAYPASPLLKDMTYRKAFSLSRSAQAGKAVLALTPPTLSPEAVQVYVPPLYPDSFREQMLDTFTQFAPLGELEAALKSLPADDSRLANLRAAIRCRALAQHDFAKAEKYVSVKSPDQSLGYGYEVYELNPSPKLPPATLETDLKPMAGLYQQLAKSKSANEKAKLNLALARQWMSYRGRLTLPIMRLNYYAGSEEEKLDLLRRQNALQLGYNREKVNAELDHRDEATHALEHALAAAASQNPAVAAPALELANECLFRRAEFSLYQRFRSLETNATALSKKLHDDLVTRFPNSAEARRAVWYVFIPHTGPWMPGDYNKYHASNAMVEALDGRSFQWHVNPDEDGTEYDRQKLVRTKLAALLEPFSALPENTTLSELKERFRTTRKQLDELRGQTDDYPYAIIARLDDLTAAAATPGATVEDFKLFAGGSQTVPVFESIIKYRSMIVAPTDPSETAKEPDWKGFLLTYPDSPMAEAASFRLTRSLARASRSRTQITAFYFPDAPIPGGYKYVKVLRDDPSAPASSVLEAIGAHEARFPNGRYQDDLNLLKAGAWIDQGNFTEALRLIIGILRNPAQRDLYPVASQNLADISQRLLDPAQRAQVAAAYHGVPDALPKLKLLVEGDSFLSRLKPIMPWLEEQETKQ